MIIWILIILALYMVQMFLEPSLRYITGGKKQMLYGMSARDKPTEISVIGGRLKRSFENLKESMPIFLSLALLAEMKGITDGLVEMGAIVFVLARIVYIPAYVTDFPGLRSIVWTVGLVGMVLMVIGLWSALGV